MLVRIIYKNGEMKIHHISKKLVYTGTQIIFNDLRTNDMIGININDIQYFKVEI